ncbi:MAG: response regulator, partial [Bradymonadaceae bacterium]
MSHDADILLVEDDQAFHRVYGRLLEQEGYGVDRAEDRESARRALASNTYELVILDLMLPPDGTAEAGLDQLAEFLAEQPDCKIVVVS